MSKLNKRRKKDDEEYNPNSVQNHMNEVERLYKLHMKKFNVVCDMKDPSTLEKYQKLRIKMRERDEYVPYYNLFEKLSYPYSEYFHKVC